MSSSTKQARVLACVLCQQRKVRCDRRFPCANCVKFQVQCVPSTLAPRKRRKERELLDRIRQYEDLLRKNGIDFESLDRRKESQERGHDSLDVEGDGSFQPDGDAGLSGNPASASAATKTTSSGTETMREAKSFWDAVNQEFRDPNDDESDISSQDFVREAEVKQAFDDEHRNNDSLLFAVSTWRTPPTDLSTLHPEPAKTMLLWQTYLENVDPLLRVTHTPTLQGRIIGAIGSVEKRHPPLEALMFGIYCIAILSLDESECYALFAESKEMLLQRYQFGCQQALTNCDFLRSADRERLTAYLLYLVSLEPNTHPRSLSPMLGVAIRLSLRMGIHNEGSLAKRSVFEAEMARRLWWALVLFDSRVGELADDKTGILSPAWDCKVPLNVNDADLRPDMKEAPKAQNTSSEAIFAVVRSEIGDFVRQTSFHLEFSGPALKPLAARRNLAGGKELDALEKSVQQTRLHHIDPEIPLHFTTMWMTRSYLAKCHLMEHYSRCAAPNTTYNQQQRDDLIRAAHSMLDCDTKIMSSALSKKFRWLNQMYFPFPAYLHLLIGLTRFPLRDHAASSWEAMSENYASRQGQGMLRDTAFFGIMSKIIFRAWGAREALARERGESVWVPPIVETFREALNAPTVPSLDSGLGSTTSLAPSEADMSMVMPLDFGTEDWMFDMLPQQGLDTERKAMFNNMFGGFPLDVDMSYPT